MIFRFLKLADLVFIGMMTLILSILILLMFANGQFWPENDDDAHQDRIKSFPLMDLKTQKISQYAGYLDSSSDWRHFYWLIEADEKPMEKPLIFWLSDGPGCSPIQYLFDSIGPYFLSEKTKRFWRNKHSWTRFANIVAMDSPIGIGYSYSIRNQTKTTDFDVMEQNYAFLRKFFQKHERFRQSDIYLSGVSYSGVMIPMLADKLLNETREFPLNLKGILIGNGMTDWALHNESTIPFLYWHGIIDQIHWEWMQKECCTSNNKCHFTLETAAKHSFDCFKFIFYYFVGTRQGPLNIYDFNAQCDVRESSTLIPLCEDAKRFIDYFNREDVKHALKIPKHVEWQRCNANLHIGTKYYQNTEMAMQPYVRRIANAGVRVLIYAGDSDLMGNIIMQERFVASLGYKQIQPKRFWMHNNQVGGFVTLYSHNVSIASIRGGGHFAMRSNKALTAHLAQHFINGKELKVEKYGWISYLEGLNVSLEQAAYYDYNGYYNSKTVPSLDEVRRIRNTTIF